MTVFHRSIRQQFRISTRRIWGVALPVVLWILLPFHTAYAQTEDIPEDPGAGDDQDAIIEDGLSWYFPEYGATWVDLNDPDVDVTLDWSSLVAAGKVTIDGEQYVFVGIDSTSSTYILDEEAHDEYHPGEGDGEGIAFGLGLLQNLAGCDTVWVDPGEIIPTAEKVAPEYPVVVGQDPEDTGVLLTYSLEIQPTILYYERWGKIMEVVACVNDSDSTDILEMDCSVLPNGTFLCLDIGVCPAGYSKQVTQLWGCKIEQKEYREGIESVVPAASLQAASRDWILGELSYSYPGTYLKHPVWGLSADVNCIWNGDTCLWTYNAASLPVEDPGWYDMILSGITTGTAITPPRTFRYTLGEFGVYLIDATNVD